MRPLLLPSLLLLLLPQALHEALLAVGDVFDDCAKYGIVRSLINAGKQQEMCCQVCLQGRHEMCCHQQFEVCRIACCCCCCCCLLLLLMMMI